MSEPPDTLGYRLTHASQAELARICKHLGIPEDSGVVQIRKAYIDAADNSLYQAARRFIATDAPTYSKALLVIYKELRPYREALDETWGRVKSFRLSKAENSINALNDEELEKQILMLLPTRDTRIQPLGKFSRQVSKWLPGAGGVAITTAVTVSGQSAMRLPFALASRGAVGGPIGIILSVAYLGNRLAGPAFRKIIPATVELMLIGQRIAHMPKE